MKKQMMTQNRQSGKQKNQNTQKTTGYEILVSEWFELMLVWTHTNKYHTIDHIHPSYIYYEHKHGFLWVIWILSGP